MSTTGRPGAGRLNTSGIHLFTTLFLQLSQHVLLPVIPVCFKWPLVKEIPQLRSPEVQEVGNGFALLVEVKQWHLCGWNKRIWNVCLDAPEPVWHLLPFLVLWPWRGLGIKCKYNGDDVQEVRFHQLPLPHRSAGSAGADSERTREKTKLRAFMITATDKRLFALLENSFGRA